MVKVSNKMLVLVIFQLMSSVVGLVIVVIFCGRLKIFVFSIEFNISVVSVFSFSFFFIDIQ